MNSKPSAQARTTRKVASTSASRARVPVQSAATASSTRAASTATHQAVPVATNRAVNSPVKGVPPD